MNKIGDEDTRGSVCRSCMGGGGLISLSEHLRKIFTDCTGLKIVDGDGLPLEICLDCESNVYFCHKFISCCKRTDTNLRKIHTDNALRIDGVTIKKEDTLYVDASDVENAGIDLEYSTIKLESNGDEGFNDSGDNDVCLSKLKIELLERRPGHKKKRKKKGTVVSIKKKSISKSNKIELKKKRKSSKLKKVKKVHTVDSEERDICEDESKKRDKNIEKSVCTYCSKSFTYSRHLEQHLLLHTLDKPYVCNICEEAFINKNQLRVHKTAHSGDKPFKCNTCNMSFCLKYFLDRHEKQHNVPNQITYHLCNFCGLDFTQKGSLNIHMRLHTGEKPYACSLCTRRFTAPSQLRRHERLHNNIRPYVCSICDKAFPTSGSLDRHSRIHSGLRPYKCSYCPKAFIDSWKRREHIANSHNIAMTDIPQLPLGRKRRNVPKDELPVKAEKT